MKSSTWFARFIATQSGGWHPVSLRVLASEAFAAFVRCLERIVTGDGWWP